MGCYKCQKRIRTYPIYRRREINRSSVVQWYICICVMRVMRDSKTAYIFRRIFTFSIWWFSFSHFLSAIFKCQLCDGSPDIRRLALSASDCTHATKSNWVTWRIQYLACSIYTYDIHVQAVTRVFNDSCTKFLISEYINVLDRFTWAHGMSQNFRPDGSLKKKKNNQFDEAHQAWMSTVSFRTDKCVYQT